MHRAYPSKPTSLTQRGLFLSMWVEGKSARTIARETGVSPATVCRWINRWRQEGNVDNHKPPKGIYRLLAKKKRLYMQGNYLGAHKRFKSFEEAFWRLSLIEGMASVFLATGNNNFGFHYTGEAWASKNLIGTPYS